MRFNHVLFSCNLMFYDVYSHVLWCLFSCFIFCFMMFYFFFHCLISCFLVFSHVYFLFLHFSEVFRKNLEQILWILLLINISVRESNEFYWQTNVICIGYCHQLLMVRSRNSQYLHDSFFKCLLYDHSSVSCSVQIINKTHHESNFSN